LPVPLRLSLFYAALFATVGVQLPYWPLWLASRGLDAAGIGAVLAAVLWVKVFTNPLAGWLADRIGDRRRVMLGFALAALAGNVLFAPAHGFWPIFAVSLVAGAAFSALMPLGDNLTLVEAARHGFDYGRVRLWGSVSFIATALLGGRLLKGRAPDTVLVWLILLIFFAGATLVQASHSVYYAFGTLHWRAIGHSETAIGALWAEGVVAEIGLFLMGARLVERLGPAGLLALGGGAGIVRWLGTGVAEGLPALALLQLLHALTFGAAHLAAMHFIARAVPPDLSATAQALYSASVAGLGFGVAMALSGTLYAAFGARAYWAMAVLAGLGAAAALGVAREGRVPRIGRP
jgi:MFS transporter, PPP family, 3-phenylpropionic acid transporter